MDNNSGLNEGFLPARHGSRRFAPHHDRNHAFSPEPVEGLWRRLGRPRERGDPGLTLNVCDKPLSTRQKKTLLYSLINDLNFYARRPSRRSR